MNANYCSNCGTELPPKSAFCPSCGKRIAHGKQKRISRLKRSSWLVVATLVLWMMATSMIMAGSSIHRVERQCGFSFVTGANCVPQSVAEFNLEPPESVVGILLTVIAGYIVYRLWIKGQKASSARVMLVSILSVAILILSVATSFAGERQNDHSILSTAEKNCVDRHSIDDYINRGTLGCGQNVDARFNMTFDELTADKNESGGLLAFYWVAYAGLMMLIIVRSPKTENQITQA